MLKCKKCGSENVQIKMWVGANSNVPEDGVSDGETEDNWCPDCDTHCEIVDSDLEDKYNQIYLTVAVLLKEPLTEGQIDKLVEEVDYHFKNEFISDTEICERQLGDVIKSLPEITETTES